MTTNEPLSAEDRETIVRWSNGEVVGDIKPYLMAASTGEIFRRYEATVLRLLAQITDLEKRVEELEAELRTAVGDEPIIGRSYLPMTEDRSARYLAGIFLKNTEDRHAVTVRMASSDFRQLLADYDDLERRLAESEQIAAEYKAHHEQHVRRYDELKAWGEEMFTKAEAALNAERERRESFRKTIWEAYHPLRCDNRHDERVSHGTKSVQLCGD